ncbi:RDD family protein [Streptomyces sp. NPDC049585]|uniref:RDD family protein n=1 Tax=Streptomyces sp. NPDC049585 TaxID=3155154 RepID=UPI003443526B
MSAPTSGSADSSPPQGYYPDPSIPGYIRYWSGTAWVPGTSRPAPAEGEPMPAPPPSAVVAPRPAPPAPATPRGAEETGPVFLDEEPPAAAAGAAPATPALPRARDPRLAELPVKEPLRPARQPPQRPEAAAAAVESGQGTLDLRPTAPGAAPAASPVLPPTPVTAAPVAWPDRRAQEPAAAPAAPVEAEAAGLPARRPESAPVPRQQQPVGWAQQVQQLAQQAPPGAPWKPVVDDPFVRAAQEAQARPAGLGRRLAARLLDTVVFGGVVGAVAVPLWAKSVEHIDEKVEQARQTGRTVTVWLLDGTTGTYLAVVLAVLFVGGLLYEALPTAKWGRTLGKKLFKVRVVDIESHDAAGFGAAVRRWLVYGALGVLVIGVLNVLWCVFDRPWRQCWHDKAARTFVASG